MISFYIGGKKETAAFRQLREEAISQRKDAAAPYLAAALKSIEELEAYARKKNIILGIENRFYYREIPSLSEIGEILKRFSGGCVAYWHDTGHAQVTENLGFAEHKDYLDLYAEFIAGIHLHDIIGCQDHLAPGKGQFDFAQLKKYLKASTLKVIEAHHPAGAEEIRDGKACLEKIFNEPN
jgi:sugar phosphate isomerase/epimerase